jgi:hypothetical protein
VSRSIASGSRPLDAATLSPRMTATAPMKQHDPGAAGKVAAEVDAECAEANGDGDVAHDLAEQRPGISALGGPGD